MVLNIKLPGKTSNIIIILMNTIIMITTAMLAVDTY